MLDYLGIGAGAHGKISFADGRMERSPKPRQPADYLAACSGTFTTGSRELERSDIVGEFMLNALRLNEGFTRALFEARTGLDFAVVEPQLLKLQERELIVCDDRGIRVSALGRRFLDSVIAEFFPD